MIPSRTLPRWLPLLLSLLLGALATMPAAAQTTIAFWHSQDTTEGLIQRFADEFNASQREVRVEPRYVGPYGEGALKLIAALRSGGAPALFDAELTVYLRLVGEDALADLAADAADLPPDLLADLEPALWEYGRRGDARYGLPWNMSLPVLVYNASVFEALGLEPPVDWEAFEATARRLTTRNARGYIDVSAAFIFEALVTSRGGSLVTPEGEPAFDGPEALDALAMLARMARARTSLPHSFAELDQALVDFARGKGMMAIASQAFFPQGERFAVAFEVGAAPIPAGAGGARAVPFTGAQLVVPRTASDAERRGAVAFWRWLVEPDTLQDWVEASYFLPVRASVAERLEPWYADDPARRAGIDQLPYAAARPQTPDYALWQSYLEEALERVVKGGADPGAELAEVQRRALETH